MEMGRRAPSPRIIPVRIIACAHAQDGTLDKPSLLDIAPSSAVWLQPAAVRPALHKAVDSPGEYSSTRPNIRESHSETPEHSRIP